MPKRYAVVNRNLKPARVMNVVEVGDDENYVSHVDIDNWESIQVGEDVPVEEGWAVTDDGRFADVPFENPPPVAEA